MPGKPLYGERMVPKTLNLPPTLIDKLERVAAYKHTTFSALVRPALEETANKLYPELSDTENLGDC